MTDIDFKAQAEAIRDDLIQRRRDLHQHPELAYQEVRTAGIIAEELNELGLEVQTGVGKTGVVGILEGQRDGPTVLYRADMDALPILEENTVDYVSQNPGVMHACGHDGHVTIGLGVARLLAAHRDKIAGRIKFAFQPAEEGGGGARAMIQDGVLSDPAPDLLLGMHLWNHLPVGSAGVADGAIMAGGSRFQIDIKGVGGHGAMPHTTNDAVVCAAELITALNMLPSRRINQLAETTVLSVTSVESSSKAFNVIPDSVQLRGTYRTLNSAIGRRLGEYIREVCAGVCAAAGCTAEVDIEEITVPVVNSPEVVSRVRRVFGDMLGEDRLDSTTRTMASEDVSYLMADLPSMYIFVGSMNAEKGLTYSHHHPRFDFDEEALPLAVALMSAAVADYVIGHGE
jgi:amidohydrolase